MHTGVYLSLGSTSITTNNTEILITGIGDDVGIGRPSLICHTDLVACCRPSETMARGIGLWHYPNGARVPGASGSNSASQPFVTLRNVQSIELARREYFTPPPLSPTGSYCCIILTNERVTVTFCANLGEWLGKFTLNSIHNPLPVVCPSLPALNNGIVSYNDSTLGLYTVATYTCDTGYTLIGGTTRTCESDGMWWSGSAPVCQGKWNGMWTFFIECTLFSTGICFDLPPLTNGMISYNDAASTNIRPVGTVAIFSCDIGYTLNEDATKTCGNDGMWSGSDPVCQRKWNGMWTFFC